MPLRPEPKLDYLTKDQVNALLGATKLPHLVVYVALACATGARNSALLELTWDRVDLQRRFIDFTTDSHHKKQYQNWSFRMAFADFVRDRVPRYSPPQKPKPKEWSVYDLKPGDLCLWTWHGIRKVRVTKIDLRARHVFGEWEIEPGRWNPNGCFLFGEIAEYR